MDINQYVDILKGKAEEVKTKIDSVDWDQLKDEIKGIDMGVAYTKALDAMEQFDVKGKIKSVEDKLDSPEMDKLKGVLRTVKDFMGFVPNYMQSVPNMIKEALGKDV